MSANDLPSITSSAQWRDHYRDNADDQRHIPWEQGLGVTPAELAEIAESLRAWQLGETSDGRHLLAAAQRYADRIGDPDFLDAVAGFIKEEQRHGEYQGRFLDMAGVPRKQSDWGDSLFRAARYLLPSMEVWATPVVMVETHALIYYNAIRQATKCPVLRAICAQILADEVKHVRFQCEQLAVLLRDRPRWLRVLTMLLHRVFFTGVTLAIWIGHRRALRAGGYGFGRFWRSAWARMRCAWSAMDPTGYAWTEAPSLTALESAGV
ncbi:MAG: ferritin-like domain-containing protein [Planctomycetes bacterium]|nr:ferritin-like domain-containing protein [Planctomycetota bacterium]